MMTMEEILNGRPASEVFSEIMDNDHNLENLEIASIFKERFPKVDDISYQVIWNWKSRTKPFKGLNDADLDLTIRKLLEDAGYL